MNKTSARVVRWGLVVAGALMLLFGAYKRRVSMGTPLAYHDEGLLLTFSDLVLKGEFPFRDFYSVYPPGIYFLTAAIWKVTGVSARAIRAFGALLIMGLSLLGGRHAGSLAGKRFSWIGGGLVALWLVPLSNVPFAFLVAEALTLVAIEILSAEVLTSTAIVSAGALLGVMSIFRHDLFSYFWGLSVVVTAVVAWRARRDARLAPLDIRRLATVLAIAGVLAAGLWCVVIAVGGARHVWNDLVYSLAHYIMPVRRRPFPNVIAWAQSPALGFSGPAFLTQNLEAGLVLSLLGPLLGVVLFAKELAAGVPSLRSLLLTVLAVAVIPQMSGRTDVWHVLQSVPIAVILASALIERSVGPRPVGRTDSVLLALLPAVLLLGWLIVPTAYRSSGAPKPSATVDAAAPIAAVAPSASGSRFIGLPREAGIPQVSADIARSRKTMADAVLRLTGPDDPLFIGAAHHERVNTMELDLYFLLNRRGGSRYMEYEPNLESREEVQREMIADLESRNVKVAVLSDRIKVYPHPKDLPGSHVLDDYLAAHFKTVVSAPPYTVLERAD